MPLWKLVPTGDDESVAPPPPLSRASSRSSPTPDAGSQAWSSRVSSWPASGLRAALPPQASPSVYDTRDGRDQISLRDELHPHDRRHYYCYNTRYDEHHYQDWRDEEDLDDWEVGSVAAHRPLADVGLARWAEPVRQREPRVANRFSPPHSSRRDFHNDYYRPPREVGMENKGRVVTADAEGARQPRHSRQQQQQATTSSASLPCITSLMSQSRLDERDDDSNHKRIKRDDSLSPGPSTNGVDSRERQRAGSPGFDSDWDRRQLPWTQPSKQSVEPPSSKEEGAAAHHARGPGPYRYLPCSYHDGPTPTIWRDDVTVFRAESGRRERP